MKVYREITPLADSDVFVLLDSVNKGFNYPIHNHPEFEINLILGSSGNRIVGDSNQKYIDTDLVLLGSYLFHKWDDEDRDVVDPRPCRVITIQFDKDLFNTGLLGKGPFQPIRRLLRESERGIRFTGAAFEQARELMMRLTTLSGMDSFIVFLQLLDLLAHAAERTYLASEGFNIENMQSDSRRIQAVYQYLARHFADSTLKLSTIAALVHMSDSAFSHFFKKYTNKSFTEFLIHLRVGHACKLLLETDERISQIALEAGFNNLANFNRLFKKYRDCTPLQFRRQYGKKTQFDWNNQITPNQFLPTEEVKDWVARPREYGTRLVHN